MRDALRLVLTTGQAMLVSCTKAIDELERLIGVAPGHPAAGLRGCSLAKELDRVEHLHARPGHPEYRVTVLTLHSILHRPSASTRTAAPTRHGEVMKLTTRCGWRRGNWVRWNVAG